MSRHIAELESVLGQLLAEHRRLLGYLDKQQAAMRKLDVAAMGDAANQQEAARLRIVALETRRRAATDLVARELRTTGPLTLSRLGALYPPRAKALAELRAQLREVVAEIQGRTHVSSRLAGAVLGHLNTVVRLVSGAVERAGLYTKQGVPKVSSRIGMMEAVG